MASNSSRREFLGLAGAGVASLSFADAASGPAAEGAAARKPKSNVPFQLGIASYTFREFNLDETLAMTKRVGIENICFKSVHLPLEASPDQIARVVAKVKAAGLNLYGGGVITMNNEADVKQAFEYAKAAGMRTIIGAPAPAVLPLVDAAVKQYNIQVAIHNHGPGDKTYPTPESVYEKIKALDKRIGLCIDIGHTMRIGADPVRDAERFGDRLLDLHVKDVLEPTPETKEIVVGRGIIDIPALVRVLRKVNFTGIASFEYEHEPKDPLVGLAESVGYVRGVMATV